MLDLQKDLVCPRFRLKFGKIASNSEKLVLK